MPRDLSAMANDASRNAMPRLTKSPDNLNDEVDPLSIAESAEEEGMLFGELSQRNEKRDDLHPYTQTLTLSDLDSCTRLEEAAFPPSERASREKFQYRLKTCSELCMGIFTSIDSSADPPPTTATSGIIYSGTPERKAVLLGHIIATKSQNSFVTDADMDIPSSSDSIVGHSPDGRTLCIHSLAVLPDYQRRGLGRTLIKAYLQRMHTHDVADEAALIAHESHIPFYESLGFINHGESKATFGGGGWWNLTLELDADGIDNVTRGH